MANNNDLPWWLLGLGVLGGGFVLAGLLAKDRERIESENANRYSCYQCNETVVRGMQRCPHCQAPFDWPVAVNG